VLYPLATLPMTFSDPYLPKRTAISTFCDAFDISLAGNSRHFKFGMWVEHNISQPTDDKPSLKWAWSRHVIQLKFQGLPIISQEKLKLESPNFLHR